jgi:hypothetical protein
MVLMHINAHVCDHNNSGHADRRTVAGRALGDLVRKLGDTVSIEDTQTTTPYALRGVLHASPNS